MKFMMISLKSKIEMNNKEALLLISNNPDDVAFGQEVARLCGSEFTYIGRVEQLEPRISAASSVMILIDLDTPGYEKFEAEIRRIKALIPDVLSPNNIHFITSSQKLDHIRSQKDPLGGTIILRKYGAGQETPKDAGEHFTRVIRTALSHSSFGLQNQMSSGTPILSYRFDSSQQKALGVEATEKYLLEKGINARIASLIATAVDEILLNAIFDAPADASGNQIYSQLPRRTILMLPRERSVELHVGVDGEYIGISIVDYFGSLKRDTVLKRAIQVVNGDYVPDMTVQNGGLGIAMVVRTGGSFFFVSETQVKTEVSMFFKRAESYKEFTSQFQFISTKIIPLKEIP